MNLFALWALKDEIRPLLPRIDKALATMQHYQADPHVKDASATLQRILADPDVKDDIVVARQVDQILQKSGI